MGQVTDGPSVGVDVNEADRKIDDADLTSHEDRHSQAIDGIHIDVPVAAVKVEKIYNKCSHYAGATHVLTSVYERKKCRSKGWSHSRYIWTVLYNHGT
ncbi:unnamed protein product [Allacma fusca]|uniref:Uncharacterized protein n=1 Tax=Allacma fusca TaxID=39272 RepID=A0A8J2P1R9_9HEXA|nr:unnamed protein product [Allacma fusca]